MISDLNMADKCFENNLKKLFVNMYNIMRTILNFVKND